MARTNRETTAGPATPRFGRGFLLTWILVGAVGCMGGSVGDADRSVTVSERPNVLFILADDLGYMDVGAYNPDTFYETPHIDALAARGMKFTAGYAANSSCSPTRYSIMTGRYPTRDDRTNWFCGQHSPNFRTADYECFMSEDQFTIAEAFREGGYSTWFGGKWHLGNKPRHWPENQGFDVNVGGWTAGSPTHHGGTGYFSPYGNPRLQDGPDGEYLPYRLADEAVRFIEQDRDEPFFAYLSFYLVHTPIEAPDSLVEKYRRKRAAMGLNGVEELEEIRQVWPTDEPRMVRTVQGDPTYAAMVEALDTAVGRVLRALDRNGVSDETVVVFTSDNGGLSTSGGHPTSNRPLRGGKAWAYEGGIREPFIIYWPGVTRPGSISEEPAITMDFYPTLLEIAGLPARPEQHQDGVSLVPILEEEGGLDRDALFWHYPHYGYMGGFPGGAVRMGPWKLVEDYEDGTVSLFNLEDDLGERRDLADARPDRTETLRNRLHDWYKELGAAFLRPRRAEPVGPEPWSPY